MARPVGSRTKGNTASTWHEFNQRLNKCGNEREAMRLLDAELAGPKRRAHVMRAFSRYNRLRSERERRELEERIK